MNKIKSVSLILIMSFIILLTGCNYDESISDEHIVNNGGAYKEDVENSAEQNVDETLKPEKIEPKVTKMLSIFNIELETENLDEDIKAIDKTIHGLKGYISSHKIIENLDKDYKKSAKLTLRVPKEKASKFIEYTKANFNVILESSETIEITDTFFDLELSIESLDKQEEQLLLMYERTTSIDDMLKISDRLTEISKDKKKLTIDYSSIQERMNYSTVEIVFNEVSKLTNANAGLGERINKSISSNWGVAKEIISNIIVFIVNYFLIIFLLVAGIIVHFKLKNRDKSLLEDIEDDNYVFGNIQKDIETNDEEVENDDTE